MTKREANVVRMGRRAFLKQGTLLLTASSLSGEATASLCQNLCWESQDTQLRFGIMTDLHFADKPAAGSRYYQETPRKLAEAVEAFAERSIEFVVELGDLIDAADDVETEIGFLSEINREFAKISEDRHYVLGNHCVYTLTKEEFLGEVEQKASYYSFDRNGIHFVVLDSCFRSDDVPYQRRNFKWTDPNVPKQELDWLREDLKDREQPTVVFAHQRLDVANSHGVKNAEAVREILEANGHVLAVFQGHSHQNDLKEIGGIPYCTLVAMVEGSGLDNSGFGLIEIDKEANIKVHGFRRQRDYTWKQES